MKHRHLGRSGLVVSRLALGTMTWGGDTDEDDAAAQLIAFHESGGTLVDTADVYVQGESERVLGRLLSDVVPRDEVLVATKAHGKTGPGPMNRGTSRGHLLSALEASLRRLQTDYVDLYQAHRYDYETPLEETMQAFADIVRQGKALYIGVSEWTANQIRSGHELAQDLGFQLISSQPQYSMLWRVIEAEVVPTCRELGISQIVWSPIAQGVLTGKYLPGQAPPAGSRATDEKGGADMISRFMRDDVLSGVQRLVPIAAELDLTPAQLAIAWVLQHSNVSAAIIGATRPEQVRENIKAAGVRLDDDLLRKIGSALGHVVITGPALTRSPAERP